MSNKTAYIISLKYAPGLMKEFTLMGNKMSENGFDVRFLLSDEYSRLGCCDERAQSITVGTNFTSIIGETAKHIMGSHLKKIFMEKQPDFVCFYNPHPLNVYISLFLKKKYPRTKKALYLHDPYKPDKKPYGFLKAGYITLVELVQDLTVKNMEYVISPSEYSKYLFWTRHSNFKGGNYIAPLIVPDCMNLHGIRRRYFSIVGGAHLATGHDTFISLVNYSAEKELGYGFALISSSNIEGFLKNYHIFCRNLL